ncbi:MAG TPA: MFS transporter [Caulobacteraceae bacterium]|nr:MFS transporter [Caulobacteraceae bacterium]
MTASTESANRGVRQTYVYFGFLTLLVYLLAPSSYLVDITTSYMLKNNLHASATQVSMFRLLTAIPIYVAFIFGFIRDSWNPFGLRDRGYFLIFAPVVGAVFVWMAFSRISYQGLFIGMFLVMLSSRFVSAAYQGLMALVGQERLMSGRLSALWQIVSGLPILAGAFASGWMAEHLRPSQTFLLLAALAFLIGVFSLWKPAAVFANTYEAPQARGSDLVGDIKRLFRHKAIYPAVLLIFMFQFAPGSNTPLQYYLTNHLHASDAIYGDFQGIFAAAFIPVFLLYGWLCKRVSLGKLLFWGIVISVPQMVPLAFIHSASDALWAAAPIGAMGGIAAAALFDLAMRSCPPGMQGTLMMMVEAGNLLSTRGGDLLGSWIYGLSPTNGFLYCVIAITVVYALMLPVLRLIPPELLATADGEHNPVVEAELLAEIAETAPSRA